MAKKRAITRTGRENLEKRSKRKNKRDYHGTPCVIGIDQSYTCTGIAIAIEGKLRKIKFYPYKSKTSKTERRDETRKIVEAALNACLKQFEPKDITIIVERIRTYSTGHSGLKNLSVSFIKAQAALIASIVDVAWHKGVKVYSVDTRAWKSRVLGTSKPLAIAYPGVNDPKKIREVKYIVELGFGEELIQKRKPISYNDDGADAACIALYGFSGEPYNMKVEE